MIPQIKLLKISDEVFSELYYKYLQIEWKELDFSSFNPSAYKHDFLKIFKHDNVINIINSMIDNAEFMCSSYILMNNAKENDNEYWYFYYQHNLLNFLLSFDDLLYILVQEVTEMYQVKKDYGFRRELVKKLKESDDVLNRKFAKGLNKYSLERTRKYRDNNIHNVKSYRRYNQVKIMENSIIASFGSESIFESYEKFEDDFQKDLQKLLKKSKLIKQCLLELNEYKDVVI
ncbi:Cthe_2314 family HEPN domain-containing protein [Macrococcoides caseolyticum]|uniref:Cthe_2314 family HEPN domain-containing protein n=1 Tax=Macrococcoides caseolyticum TaxID=69966 RepID=UPI0018E1507D|nr:Cthe_2314 family HEPN domain-containing protein [Macrococcus caseolyticus]QQB05697.1 hypothetical protein I6H62_00635 [Macrococcus caseolyticus]